MRGLVFDGPGEIRFTEDLPEPVIEAPTDVIVDVSLAGLCGSDLHPFEGREPCASGVIPGHEAVGVVSATGPSVETVAIGDRVIVPFTTSCGHCDRCAAALSSRCRSSRLFGWGDPTRSTSPLHGAQAERLRVPFADGTLVAVPEGIDDPTALLLADNFPTAFHAVTRTDWTEGPMAIIGLGAVGLCAVAAARSMGVPEILAIDPIETRRLAATHLGASASTPDEASGSYPAVIEAAGPRPAQQLAATLAAVGGTISIIAVQTAESFGIDPVTVYDKNLTVRSGRAPVRSLLAGVLSQISAGSLRVPTDSIITHPYRPLSDGPGMYRAFAARHSGLIKATFEPSLA